MFQCTTTGNIDCKSFVLFRPGVNKLLANFVMAFNGIYACQRTRDICTFQQHCELTFAVEAFCKEFLFINFCGNVFHKSSNIKTTNTHRMSMLRNHANIMQHKLQDINTPSSSPDQGLGIIKKSSIHSCLGLCTFLLLLVNMQLPPFGVSVGTFGRRAVRIFCHRDLYINKPR